MSEWCQNKKCPDKKTQSQIRGTKGAKYYQSNKSSGYYKYWCSMGCREQWWNEHKETCMNAVGFIDKQVLPLEDAWYVEYNYDWNSERQAWNHYYLLSNKLFNVRHPITRLQATGNNHDDYSPPITSAQAKELAQQLGLTPQQ